VNRKQTPCAECGCFPHGHTTADDCAAHEAKRIELFRSHVSSGTNAGVLKEYLRSVANAHERREAQANRDHQAAEVLFNQLIADHDAKPGSRQ
jgi:hypothetical protein